MQAAFGMFVPEEYIYDNYGNPIKYRNNTLEWERGTFLKKYGKTECTYDVNNKLVIEVGDGRAAERKERVWILGRIR